MLLINARDCMFDDVEGYKSKMYRVTLLLLEDKGDRIVKSISC